MAGIDARTLACAADLFARSRNFRYEGIAIASRIPMMMITTRSSIRVKPPWLLLRLILSLSFSSTFLLLVSGKFGGSPPIGRPVTHRQLATVRGAGVASLLGIAGSPWALGRL